MSNYYTYLISSLPMLHFGVKPPFSFEIFLEKCRDCIPQEDIVLLESVAHTGMAAPARRPGREVMQKWQEFERGLRNELVKVRAARKKTDPLKYIRGDGYAEPFIAHIALNAYRNTSSLDAERMLDIERWRFLDELALGHYFDIDALTVYAYKLSILLRWEKINRADKAKLLQEALGQN